MVVICHRWFIDVAEDRVNDVVQLQCAMHRGPDLKIE
jgi:hypothetical protein